MMRRAKVELAAALFYPRKKYLTNAFPGANLCLTVALKKI